MQPGQEQPPPAYQGVPKQQTMVVQHQPQVTAQQGSDATSGAVNQRGGWVWKGLRITGYMQIVMGVLAVVFGIVSVVLKTHLYSFGVPIWCGLCFLTVTGILGVVAGRKQMTGLVIAYMVMSLLSMLAACGIIGVGGGAIETDTYVCPDNMYVSRFSTYYNRYTCSTSSGVRVGIDVCILLIGIAELVIAGVGASFSCCSLCYKCCNTRSSTPQTVVAFYPQQMAGGAPPQCVYYPPGAVAYPGQVVMQPGQTYQLQGQFQPPPQGQFQPPPQGQFQPPPQGQVQPPPQGQVQPPPQGQAQPPPQGQVQPPPQGQVQPPPQGQVQPPPQQQVHPEAPPDPQ